jgi:pimeloyl-ACP methyl ester carboxylesterase
MMLRVGFIGLSMFVQSAVAHAQTPLPLEIAQQGYFFVGGSYTSVGDRQIFSGQAYVEYQIPRNRTQRFPIVIIPGGAQTATNFNGTPDGREGWTQFFLRRGYAVYIMEQVGRSRSGYAAEVDGPQSFPTVLSVESRFTAPQHHNLYPQAGMHTQWPGTGRAGDPFFDQFYASQVPYLSQAKPVQTLNRDAGVALLDKIGPAILMTHSQSGSFAWTITEARPDLVKASVQIEPSGPPVHDITLIGPPGYFKEGPLRPWGLTSIPITYDPPVNDASELQFVRQEKPDSADLARCWLQKEPARQLPMLQKAPILIVTGEASFHSPYEHCDVKFFQQAGVHPTWIRLGDVGIHGNGHMMMLEKNNMQIADLITGWLAKTLPTSAD